MNYTGMDAEAMFGAGEQKNAESDDNMTSVERDAFITLWNYCRRVYVSDGCMPKEDRMDGCGSCRCLDFFEMIADHSDDPMLQEMIKEN